MVSVGGAATGAIEPRPAVTALLMGVDVAGGKLALDGMVCDALPDVAQTEFFIASLAEIKSGSMSSTVLGMRRSSLPSSA